VFKDLRGLRDRARVGASINRYTTQKKKKKKEAIDLIGFCVCMRELSCARVLVGTQRSGGCCDNK
jgi:hypothetical protein